MEDKVAGFLVTLVIIILIVSYILSAVGVAVQSTLEFVTALWQSGYLTVQEVLAGLGSWPGSFEWPEIGWPTIPAGPGTPPAQVGTPVAGGALAPGGQAVVANTGGDRLNCRADAAVSSGVVTKLEQGAVVTLIQSQRNAADGYTWWQVSTTDKGTCWVAANWLLLVAAPLPTPTIVPVPTVTPTPAPGNGLTVAGRVSVTVDGKNMPLPGVNVVLKSIHPAISDVETYTNPDGSFQFPNVWQEQGYYIQVLLQTAEKIPPNDNLEKRLQIRYDKNTEPVGVETTGFVLLPITPQKDIDLADSTLQTLGNYNAKLVDMAVMYNYTYQMKDFFQNRLNYTGFYSMKAIQAFYNPQCGGNSGVYSQKTEIFTMYQKISSRTDPFAPLNREWHEGSHHLMKLVMPQSLRTILSYYTKSASAEGSNCPDSPTPTPTTTPKAFYENHKGYENWNSGDSWIEGWAVFWPCVLKHELDSNHQLPQEGCRHPLEVPLEQNIRIWDSEETKNEKGETKTLQFEEYAVASLLWDLYDPRAGIFGTGDGGDKIDLSAQQLFLVLADAYNPALTSMRQVYLVLNDRAGNGMLLNENGSKVTVAELDTIFKNHGFFADENENHKCDKGEAVGYAGWKNGAPRE